MKPKLYLDIDNTLVNSSKSFCKQYNLLYKDHPQFIPADWTKVVRYNFKCQCPLLDDVESIFEMEEFFNNLEFINDNTYEVLEELNEVYKIILVSIGNYGNISLKSQFVHDKIKIIKDAVFIINDGTQMKKDLCNMFNGIFLDDVSSNLFSSNAMHKICFGMVEEWNSNWLYDRCLNWTEVKYKLLRG